MNLKMWLRVSRPSSHRSPLLLPSTIRKNCKREWEDSQEVLQSLKWAVLLKLKSLSLKTGLRTHSVPPGQLKKRELLQAVVLLSFMPQRYWKPWKVPTSTKTKASKLSRKPAKSHARQYVRIQASRVQSSLKNYWRQTKQVVVSMPRQVNTVT